MTETQISSSETKIKILQSARRLFSEHGFYGASVRDIAKDSEVNLAAINYHFKNKENLFWSIITESFENAERACKELATQSEDLIDFSNRVFNHFLTNRELMRNTMKLLLSNKMAPPAESPCCNQLSEGVMGPPGGQYFAQFLAKEIPFDLNSSAVLWGVKSIFGTVVHWSTMCATAHFEALAVHEPQMRPEQIRKDVERVVRATVEFIKNNSVEFKA